jgi:hypothetical protein
MYLTTTISNTNVVPLRDVQPSIGICFLEYPGYPSCNGPAKSKIAFKPFFVKWLDADEKYQIALEDAIKITNSPQQIRSANITIAITYTPWHMPYFWRSTKEFRFVTKERSDGKIYWTPVPLNL